MRLVLLVRVCYNACKYTYSQADWQAAMSESKSIAPSVVPTVCTAACLRRITRRMTAFYEPYLLPAGLTLSQYSLLSNLSETPQSLSELADHLEMDRTTLTRNLAPLLERGWAGSKAGKDARRRLLFLTPEGRKVCRAAYQAWKRAQQALEKTLGRELVMGLHHQLDQALSKLKPALPEEN